MRDPFEQMYDEMSSVLWEDDTAVSVQRRAADVTEGRVRGRHRREPTFDEIIDMSDFDIGPAPRRIPAVGEAMVMTLCVILCIFGLSLALAMLFFDPLVDYLSP